MWSGFSTTAKSLQRLIVATLGIEIQLEPLCARPLCPMGISFDGNYKLCLDGVEIGDAKFVSGSASYFFVQTNAETASRLQSALAP